jgi:hypothetical protein
MLTITTSPIRAWWRGLLLCMVLCCLPGPASSQNEGIYFGLINLQMRSLAETTAQELLFSILSQTTTFLEMALKEKFKSSQYDFTHVTLSVEEFSLDVSSDGGKFDADCRLQGIAMFEAGSSPSSDAAVKQVVRRALDEENSLFLQALRKSDNPFLQDILFAVVTTEDGDPSFGRPPNATDGNESEPDSSTFIAAPWMIALMVTASIGVLLILSCLVWYCYKSCQNARQHDAAVEKMRTASHSSSSCSEEGDAKFRKRSPSIPSPLHSIMSQDSSKFTFNPKSRSTKSIPPPNDMVDDNEDDGGEESTSSKHSISFFGVSFYTNSSNVDVDVDAWRKGSTVANTSNSNSSLPFGQDISAIEMHSKRDLSLIEEGENEEMTPHSSVSGGSNCFKSKQSLPNPVRLSLQSLAELERDERRRRRSSSRNKLVPPSSQPSAPLQQSKQDDKAPVRLSLNGSAAAVIDELNDLSAQIDDYRRR